MERKPGTDTAMSRHEVKAGQKRDQAGERASLDACYGRIGIPAVAAALTPRHDERRPAVGRRFTPYDRD